MREGDLQERAEKEGTAEVAEGQSGVFLKSLCRLCKALEAEETTFISDYDKRQEPGSDKRQDTPTGALPGADIADTGILKRGDKRRDTSAKG